MTTPAYPAELITTENLPNRGAWGVDPPAGMWPDEMLIRLKNEIAALQAAVGITGQATRRGFIHIPLNAWALTESDDVPAIAVASGNGGKLARDTAPKLQRVNGATDKALRIEWAAASVIEIQADIVYPPDLDDTADVTFHILAAMGGATDVPTVAVSFWEGLGDANAGGNTAAVTGIAIAEYTRTIAAANIGAAPKSATITLIPAAHGTDELHVYGTWIEYQRKMLD